MSLVELHCFPSWAAVQVSGRELRQGVVLKSTVSMRTGSNCIDSSTAETLVELANPRKRLYIARNIHSGIFEAASADYECFMRSALKVHSGDRGHHHREVPRLFYNMQV